MKSQSYRHFGRRSTLILLLLCVNCTLISQTKIQETASRSPFSDPKKTPIISTVIPPIRFTDAPTNQQILPTPSHTPESTTTSINHIEPQIITPLQNHKDYIIYVERNSQDKSNEIWAINPTDGTPFMVIKGWEIWPAGWSPSGKYWLFSRDFALYIANANGTSIHLIFQDQDYFSLSPVWISDAVILVNAYSDPELQLPPDIYKINIETGEFEGVKLDRINFVQSASPSQGVWIGSDWDLGFLQSVDRQGYATTIMDRFKVSLSPYSFDSIQFMPGKGEFIYVATERGQNKYALWMDSISQSSAQKLFEQEESATIRYFEISPDGHFIGLLYNLPPNIYFYVLENGSNQLKYQWLFPFDIGNGYFHWSPDQQYIVLPYQSMDLGKPATSSEIFSGIQIMNVSTGETSILLKKNVIQIVSWHYID